MLEKLNKSKNNEEKNKIQVNLIKSGLRYFKEEIKDMSKEDKETERTIEIVNIVEKILEFNRQQSGQGLKILTPDQMLNRLPIPLAQLKVRNNSKKNLKMKSDNYYILCTDKKNLQSKSMKV